MSEVQAVLATTIWQIRTSTQVRSRRLAHAEGFPLILQGCIFVHSFVTESSAFRSSCRDMLCKKGSTEETREGSSRNLRCQASWNGFKFPMSALPIYDTQSCHPPCCLSLTCPIIRAYLRHGARLGRTYYPGAQGMSPAMPTKASINQRATE
jgi:hypothetical protein